MLSSFKFKKGLSIIFALFVLFQTAMGATATIAEAQTTGAAVSSQSFEAEAAVNQLSGKAAVKDCEPAVGCSGNQLVGSLWGGSALQFNAVNVDTKGIYTMTVHYISGDPRSLAVSVNGGGADHYDFPKTADWSTRGTYEIQLELRQGENVIRFDDEGGYAPDIDKIELKLLNAGPGTDPNEPPAGSGQVYEAEGQGNKLTGNSAVRSCKAETDCSDGKKVGDIWGGSSLLFQKVAAPAEGVYTLKVSYISGDPRSFAISVNNSEKETYSPPATANWDTVGMFSIEVQLQAGSNTILFDDNGGWSPDIDKIEIISSQAPGENPGDVDGIGNIGKQIDSSKFGSIKVEQHKSGVTLTNGVYKIIYNTESGLSAFEWNNKTIAKGLYSSIQLDKQLDSKNYAEHLFSMKKIEKINDGHGKGIRVTIENRESGLPTMKQIYQIYERLPYFLISQQVTGKDTLSTNDMAPLVLNAKGGIDIGSHSDNRVLVAPFDNDAWSRYQARTINTSLNNNNYVSSELTAIYDNTGRNGLIIGSVTHDKWKTGIYWSGSEDRLNKLKVYGGFTSPTSTHDTIPHGKVTGTTLTSPQILVGYYADYRVGLESFGQANAAVAPPLSFKHGVPKGVPVGWNSWGAYESDLSYDKVVAVSDFFKKNLQKNSFSNKGNVYINLDSYWDNLSEEQLKQVVKVINKNGQKAGIYYGPFVYWGDNMSQVVEGTDGKYTYGDIILRDQSGSPLPKVDGAYAIDPTHPGSKQRIEYYFKRFLDYGYEYIKIDFLSHGSFEGKHFDPNVQTGIQAYNQGMAHINKVLGGKMFISASIAPLFPSQYAHARRISCDIDGSLSRTEYQLNNLTYGWWQNGTIYPYTDPDYMTLAKGGSFDAAQTRVNSAAISGTVFLSSDDVSDPAAQDLMKKLLTNKQVNEVALKGQAFKPVEGNTGTGAADMFIMQEGKNYYLAVFNYTNDPVSKTVDFARAGIPSSSKVKVTDLWTNVSSQAAGQLKVDLKGAQSKLYKITVK
ncbi:carbohydrate-binding protein [Paenibacillus sp. FSL H8-0548]|uniref:carbohydrate-binding protein n=1 Tax=Paenibacillus sp. FSL H8-0548 TaxID=1920422 RepID=UPI00096FE98A|nr:carbohydrate-binding protein [Paenibacillus sp. FSL H8-0548]OMF36000.1 carbohydrate-binding protein [Paenibacillus sp. FSL H8-0548]